MPHSAFQSRSASLGLLYWRKKKEYKNSSISFLLVIKTDHKHFFMKLYSKQIKCKALSKAVHWSGVICQEEGSAIKNFT